MRGPKRTAGDHSSHPRTDLDSSQGIEVSTCPCCMPLGRVVQDGPRSGIYHVVEVAVDPVELKLFPLGGDT